VMHDSSRKFISIDEIRSKYANSAKTAQVSAIRTDLGSNSQLTASAKHVVRETKRIMHHSLLTPLLKSLTLLYP